MANAEARRLKEEWEMMKTKCKKFQVREQMTKEGNGGASDGVCCSEGEAGGRIPEVGI